MLTQPKTGLVNRRVIVDLSWPHGFSFNDEVSVNTYMGTQFKLKFTKVDDIVARVVELKYNCLIYKINLQ